MKGILPGESIATLPNGNILLTMRNGNTHEFTPSEWNEHNEEFMDDLPVSEMIDLLLNEIKGRQTVQTSEMIDGLLDLRQRAVRMEQGFKNAVDCMLSISRDVVVAEDEQG